MKHFLSLEKLEVEQIENLVQLSIDFKKGIKKLPSFKNVMVSNLFFENSTRTKSSFFIAQKKTEMDIIEFDVNSSSVIKGETLYDTVKSLESMGVELLIIRHKQERFYENLLPGLKLSLVNAGDGCANHPSQSLLDLVTIFEEFGKIKDLKIMIAGDLLHSRVAHSNAKILKRLGAKLYFSSPKQWEDNSLKSLGEFCELKDNISQIDVLIMLRIQNERHSETEYFENYLATYGLTKELEKLMKPSAIIMHPGPVNRGVEIDNDLIESQKSRILEQIKNGVYARISILNYVLTAN